MDRWDVHQFRPTMHEKEGRGEVAEVSLKYRNHIINMSYPASLLVALVASSVFTPLLS